MSLRNEIAKIVKAGLDDYFCEVVANEYDVTDQILALIEAERCVWTEDEDGIMHTGCGKQRCYDYDIRTALDGDPYCPCCGHRIEAKEVKDASK